MADPFILTKVLAEEDISHLHKLYVSLKGKNLAQDHNLYNVTKKTLPVTSPALSQVTVKLRDYSKMDINVMYFLKYKEGAFAKMHVDNPDRHIKTCITMIHTSNNLIGGDSLIYKVLEKDDMKPWPIVPPGKKFDSTGKPVIPIIVKQPVGTSLWYDKNTMHGVSRVEQGMRIVLVTWFG